MPISNGAIAPIHGATLELLIGVNLLRRDALRRVNLPVPERIRVVAQIDTGTALSAMDRRVLTGLDLTPTNEMRVRTPTSAEQEPSRFDQYVVSIGIDSGEGIEALFDNIEVLGTFFAPDEGIQGMLGRDVLEHCLLVYNGPRKGFSLAF